jgi:hypothetical protein
MRIRLRWSTFLTKGDRLLTLNRRNISFVNSVKYLGVIFDKRMTWRLHIETIEAKAFRTFIRLYSVFKTQRLSVNIKLTFHKALIRSVMTYVCPAWEFQTETYLLKLQCLQNNVIRIHWQAPEVHIGPRYACGFPNSVRLWLHNKVMQKTSRNNLQSWKCT